MHISSQNLKKIVLDSGLVTEEQFKLAEKEAGRSNRTIENVLIGKGYIPENYLGEILSKYFKVPTVNIKDIPELPYEESIRYATVLGLALNYYK